MSGGGFISSNDENICTKIEKNYNLLKSYTTQNKVKYEKINKMQNEIVLRKNKILLTRNKINSYFDVFIYNKKFSKKYFLKLLNKISHIDKINKLRNKKAKYYDKIFNFNSSRPIIHEKGSVYWRKIFFLKKMFL